MDDKPRKRADWFPVYLSQRQYIGKVDDATAGRVLKAALDYLATGELVPLNPVEDILFTAFKDSIDDAIVRFQRKSKANAENAQKRWLKKLPPDANGSESMPFAPNGNDSMLADAHIHSDLQLHREGEIQSSPSSASKFNSCAQREYEHTSEAYQIAKYLADEKARDNPDRAQPTESELQKQAAALDELHTQNGVAWDVMEEVMYQSLDHDYWRHRVQSAYDFKRYFNKILADVSDRK